MSKYDLLKQKINGLEQATFQQVSNNYLLKIFGGTLESPGTMDSKTKTKKGKPDTYLVQEDGTYIIAEITTHDSLDKHGFSAKLKNDLAGCLEFANLGITANQVRFIVLCCNSTVDLALHEELKQIILPYNIPLKIVSLLTLVDFYYNVGKVFAQDVLGIPFETGQVLSKSEFLERYRGHKQIATPLDNQLFGRERELKYLQDSLVKFDTILISGSQGVGKSRLALQVIDDFTASFPEYQPYYILSVRESIFEDLLTFLVPGKFYIVFIDDANRQIENVIAVLNRAIAGHITVKIVMTVRDYAREEVENEVRNSNFHGIVIGRLSDDTLNNMLFSAPFNIIDHNKRKRILEVSNGNPRLALMAADVIIKDPESALLKDASSIYDDYFHNLSIDQAVFNAPLTIKVMGLISFLESIDVEEPTELFPLALFDIPLEDFRRTALVLEGLEFVEIRFQSIIKISDQVLGTYFFYQAFFKKALLSPELLIHNLFERYKWRVKDTFLPAITTFGKESILGENPLFLTNYLEQIKGIETAAISFFEIFGLYLPYKLFAFVNQLTVGISIEEGDFVFNNAYKKSQLNYEDPILKLLEQFYKNEIQDFLTAAGLAIKYVQKKKQLLDQLVKQIKEPLWVTGEDFKDNLGKQFAAYNFFLNHLNDSPIFKYLFYYVFQHVCLNSSFNYEAYENRDGLTIFKGKFTQLRNQFWDEINNRYADEKLICFEMLFDYLEGRGNEAYIYLTPDQEKVTAVIKTHFSPANFEDCCFVQEYIDLLIDKGVNINKDLQNTQKRFHSPDYKIVRVLTLARNDKRQKFSHYLGMAAGENARETYFNKHINVSSLDDFKKINNAIQKLRNFKYWHKYHIGFGLTMVFESAFRKNTELGYEVLSYYLSQEKIIDAISGRLFNIVIPIVGECERLYQIVKQSNFQYKQEWLERFYETIPETCISLEVIYRMLEDYKNASKNYTLHLQWFERYETIRPGTVRDLCKVLLERNEHNPEFFYKVDYFFIEKYPFLIEHDLAFAKQLYLNQDRINHDFDPRGSELFTILKKDELFIHDYINYRLKIYKEFHSTPNMLLTQIWTMESAEKLVYETFLKFGTEEIYGFSLNSFSSNFFLNLDPEIIGKAINVLKKLIDNFNSAPRMLSMVWEVGRNYLKDQYGEIIRYWIINYANIEVFKKCDWTNNSFSYSGSKQYWGDFRATEYKRVSDAILLLPEPYLYVDFQDWLMDCIASAKKSADWERKRQYRHYD